MEEVIVRMPKEVWEDLNKTKEYNEVSVVELHPEILYVLTTIIENCNDITYKLEAAKIVCHHLGVHDFDEWLNELRITNKLKHQWIQNRNL